MDERVFTFAVFDSFAQPPDVRVVYFALHGFTVSVAAVSTKQPGVKTIISCLGSGHLRVPETVDFYTTKKTLVQNTT